MPPARFLAALLGVAAAAAPAWAGTFVYVHDRGAVNQVHAFVLEKTGELAPVPDTPFASSDPVTGNCGGNCQTMAADKKSARLFTSGATGITVWNVGEDGRVAAVTGSPFGATGALFGVAAVRIGNRLFVYGAERALDQLRGFEVQADGTLLELASSPVPTGKGPTGVVAAKRLLFATSEDDGSIASYVVGGDGALAPAPGSPLALDPPPVLTFNAAPDTKGKLLYVSDDGFADPANDANDTPPAVYAFSVDKKTAALTPVTGSPFETTMPLGSGVSGASTAKKLVVVVGFQRVEDDLQVFKIGQKGVLAPLGTVQDSGINALAHAFDPKGKWLLIASAQQLRAYRADGKTGLLEVVQQAGGELPGDAEANNAIVVLSR